MLHQMLKVLWRRAVDSDRLARSRMNKLKMRGVQRDAVNHLLTPLLRSGVLAPALVWAAAAVVLPRIVRTQPLPKRLVAVTISVPSTLAKRSRVTTTWGLSSAKSRR